MNPTMKTILSLCACIAVDFESRVGVSLEVISMSRTMDAVHEGDIGYSVS